MNTVKKLERKEEEEEERSPERTAGKRVEGGIPTVPPLLKGVDFPRRRRDFNMPHRGIVGLPLFERRGEEGLQFVGDGGGPFFRPLSTYAPPRPMTRMTQERARPPPPPRRRLYRTGGDRGENEGFFGRDY